MLTLGVFGCFSGDPGPLLSIQLLRKLSCGVSVYLSRFFHLRGLFVLFIFVGGIHLRCFLSSEGFIIYGVIMGVSRGSSDVWV